jgi:hypothetical protein
MEFGWYHEFHRQVEGQSDAGAFEQGFEQVEAADRWGLDVFWLAEIHQQARRSVLSAPMNVAGQIAARTKRIKIGTAVHVLPLTHPLRLAEETATVDVVSRGRFILGAGRSGNPRGYAAYGVPYSESRERFFDTLDILKKAWTEDSFSYKGKYYLFATFDTFEQEGILTGLSQLEVDRNGCFEISLKHPIDGNKITLLKQLRDTFATGADIFVGLRGKKHHDEHLPEQFNQPTKNPISISRTRRGSRGATLVKAVHETTSLFSGTTVHKPL